MSTSPLTRRYDLDWLRVIAFGLLIFYHIGMFYVEWGWHVKSQYSSSDAHWLMRLLNPWRLSLLFFISGIAFRFFTDKKSTIHATAIRSYRLFLPIFFGMAVIVMPQAYYQLQYQNEIGMGMLEFWKIYLVGSEDYSVSIPTWNHLWYVVYLFVYGLFLAPLLTILKRFVNPVVERAIEVCFGYWISVLILVPIPFLIIRFTLTPHFPTTHDLVSDWANHANSLVFFFLGYFFAKNQTFWRAIDKALPTCLVSSLVLASVLTLVWLDWDTFSTTAPQWQLELARAGRVLYAWFVIAALLGLAQRFLNQKSKILTYLNRAIFPYYILHQTLIVIAGFHLTQLNLGAWTEFLSLLLITVFGCAAIEFLIRKTVILRPFLGLKFRS